MASGMNLGRATLRRNGLNSLRNALHQEHGLIWTDGKVIYLAPVHLYRDQVESAGLIRLGEFDYVQSVHWSCQVEEDVCFMAAVHQQTVSVWRVSGTVPRLAFKQVRKINVQPVPQGCLWNPTSDILCLLSRHQCSFYFRHTQNRGSFAFPSLEHEQINCGCWLPDGKRLVICAGAVMLIYTWTDINANINEFVTTAWRIPGLSSSITAIEPASNSIVVCASDLPLKTLCINNTGTFVPSGAVHSQLESDSVPEESGSVSVRDILPHKESTPVQDSAMLNMVELRPGLQDPVILASTRVPGLLSPDILHFQIRSQSLVVGSNTESMLQIFALLDNRLLPAGHMAVGKDERPKGICSLHTVQVNGADGVLVLLGTAKQNDTAFPSANNTTTFDVSLKFFPTRPEKIRQFPNGRRGNTRSPSSSLLVKSDSVREPRTRNSGDSFHHTRKPSYKGERPDRRFRSPEQENISGSHIKLLLTDIKSGEVKSKLVEEIMDSPRSLVEEVDGPDGQCSTSGELETERVDFAHSTPVFHNSKLLQQYDINQNSVDEGNTNLSKSDSVSSDKISPIPLTRTIEQCAKGDNYAHSVEESHSSMTETSDSLQTDVHLKNIPAPLPSTTTENGKQDVEIGESSACNSSVHCSSDINHEMLEKQIKVQRDQIDALQKRLKDLTAMVEETSCVFPVKYQEMTESETVSIQCVVGGARVNRKFLLDRGRLQLEPVKQAFGLLTVELILDGEPVVLGANIDGYIPMKFKAGSFLQITGIPITYSPQYMLKACNKETVRS